MQLEDKQLQSYLDKGFILLPNWFSADEIAALKAELSTLVDRDDILGKAMEQNGKSLRFIYAPDRYSSTFHQLARHPRLVKLAMQIVGTPVYIHKFRVNTKAAFHGDVWHWHQDYTYWREADGMPSPQAVSMLVFLDDVTSLNGPVNFIPGSHKVPVDYIHEDEQHSEYEQAHPGMSLSTVSRKYATPDAAVERLAGEYGIESPLGAAGSILCIHPECVHGSEPNRSDRDRNVAIITYNSIYNCLREVPDPRPEWVTNRNFTPIELRSDFLLGARG